MNDEPPIVYGDGTQTRDFTYIEDIVDTNLTLLESSEADGEVLNIGSSDNIEIRTLATEIRNQLNPELEIEYAERYDADAEHTHADVSKANKLLGYSPGHTIREGVRKFVDWYKENQKWYESLVKES